MAIGDWNIAIPLFFIATFTDAVDGSLARTRRQITLWGTIADPVADKLLISSVLLLFVAEELSPAFAAVILGMELVILAHAIVRRRRHGEYSGANWAGKVKMLLQCGGVAALLVSRWFSIRPLVPAAIGTLSLAILFAVLSLSQNDV